MKTLDVSVIGELNLDLILYGLPHELTLEREHLASGLSITLGSSSAIFAHNLANLGNKVGFSSCIGSDPLGEICVGRLADSKVDVSRIRRLADKTTGLTVILPQEKLRYILTYPGTMADLNAAHLDPAYFLSAKHLHVASYFLQKSLQPDLTGIFRQAKDAGMTTSLDTNDDPEDRWSIDLNSLAQYVDVFLPNEREACKLAGTESLEDAINKLSGNFGILVVKRGSLGSTARVDGHDYTVPSHFVSPVDTVGAGDSFDAGFVHQFIRGGSIEDCLRNGNLAAALSVTRAGGTEAFRDSAHREAFLRENP